MGRPLHPLSWLGVVLLFVALLLPACSGKLTVHINMHTHDDVGWLKTVDQYYTGSNKTIDSSVVQYILTTVVDELLKDPQRKFMYVEQAFFQRFWQQQTDARKADIRTLVANRQLEFVNGGWCMHDEATTHWVDMVDQTTLGHKFIVDHFGFAANPTIGWQIDPFGHSATQAALLTAQAGLQAFFTARIDYQDFIQRNATNTTEWIWRASPSLPNATVFGGVFQWANTALYGPWPGFNYELYSTDPPIQDDPRLNEYNVDERVAVFIETAHRQAAHNRGEQLLFNAGFDFNSENSHEWYKNLDKLIAAVNANGTVAARYSTPSDYVAAKRNESLTWPLKTDDLFPYASREHEWWTGFLTSRPALKRYVRMASAQLQVLRQLEVWLAANGSATQGLWEAVAIAQHHDGVSGTSKQHVAFDYAQRISKGIHTAESTLYPALAAFITSANATAPTFSSCPLANVSVCPTTQSSSSTTVLLYNPLGRSRVERVALPVSSQQFRVVDAKGAVVPSDILPVPITPALDSSLTPAPYQLSFLAEVGPIGFSTYFLTPNATTTTATHRWLDEVQQARAAPTPYKCGQGAGFNVTNGRVTLSFSGACVLQSYSINGSTTEFSHGAGFYYGFQTPPRDGELCRSSALNSGAYLFRPQNQSAVMLPPVSASFSATGSVVTEVWLTYGDWLSEVVRLVNGSDVVEFQFTVGPIPIDDQRGKEIIMTYTAPAYAADAQTAPVIYTDSNGREFQRRVKDHRDTWTLNSSEPVASNYYPLNAAAYLNSSSHGFFSLVTDRSQGVASLTGGEMEVMVHRRLLCDDGKGVGEPINETSGITHDNPGVRYGTPLVITGSHFLQFSSSLAPTRLLQNRVYSPLHPLLAPLTGDVSSYAASHITAITAMGQDLPAEVEISHMHVWTGLIPSGWKADNTTALVRFAHSHGVGEGGDVAREVQFDLNAVLNANVTQVLQAVPVSITANQPAASIKPWVWQLDGGGVAGVEEVGEGDDVAEQVAVSMGHVMREMSLRERRERVAAPLMLTLQPGEVQTLIVQFQ